MGEYIFDKVLFDDMLGLLGLQCSLFISIQVQGCRPQKAPVLISFPLHNHLLPPQPQTAIAVLTSLYVPCARVVSREKLNSDKFDSIC